MQYIGDVTIDTHGHTFGQYTSVTLKESGKVLEGAYKVELVISATEPVVGKITLYDPWPPTTEVATREVVCPHVDLKPLVMLLEEITCGEYRVDGNSWKRLPNGDVQVIFHQVKE